MHQKEDTHTVVEGTACNEDTNKHDPGKCSNSTSQPLRKRPLTEISVESIIAAKSPSSPLEGGEVEEAVG